MYIIENFNSITIDNLIRYNKYRAIRLDIDSHS